MDIRIERTRRSIINAFLQLRSRKSLEKITVKELAALAEINKATFYLHYHDVYDLSENLEREAVQSTLRSIPHPEDILTDMKSFIHQLGDAFLIYTVCIVGRYRFEQFLKLGVDFGNAYLNVERLILGDFIRKPHADMNFQCFQHLDILLCRLHDGSHNSVLQQAFLNARRVMAVFFAVAFFLLLVNANCTLLYKNIP